ncbi:hypothetical protein [Rhizobium sp. C4]|uniref:hypothetical protein n=1 Tax=Rhizobium sp. C4 TaxID=1349800 RepID=UPI001E309C60|nr:hypothetical protein [Rhizobium sp. C4]MCD2173687.1 hypothetical protein [Rhizobium sp. C4]
MPSEQEDRQPQPLAIRLAIALMLLVALSGLALLGNGLYILARAEFSNVLQNSTAEHRVANSPCQPTSCPEDETRS